MLESKNFYSMLLFLKNYQDQNHYLETTAIFPVVYSIPTLKWASRSIFCNAEKLWQNAKWFLSGHVFQELTMFFLLCFCEGCQSNLLAIYLYVVKFYIHSFTNSLFSIATRLDGMSFLAKNIFSTPFEF